MYDTLRDLTKQQAGAQMFDQFRDQFQALATVVARRERAQLELAKRLADAADVEASIEELPDVEARASQLEAMAEAASEADLHGWYFEEFAPDDRLDNPQQAAAYAGMTRDEWQAQKRAWAENYRNTSPEAESHSDEDLAGLHVENTFGVPLAEFEANVVDWRPGEAIQSVLTAHLTTVEDVMQAVATDLEGGDTA